MTQQEIELQARLAAIEYMMANVYRLIYQMVDASQKDVFEGHDATIESLRTQSLARGSDPAVLDVASDEVLQNVRHYLSGIETMLGMVRQPKD